MTAGAGPLAVSWWPAPLAPRADGLYVIGIEGDGERQAARRRTRQALCEALAGLYGLDVAQVMIHFSAGRAPAVSFLGGAGGHPPGISISHDGPLSLAAIHMHGLAGIDLMQVRDIPDWRAVARDYLGPHVLAMLDATPGPEQAAALARAWTEREARLKCHGRQLAEWTPEPLPAQCHQLALPAGFVGTACAHTIAPRQQAGAS
jgi:4'-phosphopantetheinyl transferase